MGNYEHSYRYGQIALALTRKLKCLETQIATLTLLSLGVLHWKEPINNLVEPLSRTFSGSFTTGNLWYGALASTNTLLSSLSSGVNLIFLRDQARHFLGKFKEYKQDQLAICLQPTSQCIFHVTSTFDNWSDAVTITGAVMDEEEYLEECDRSNYKSLKGDLHTLKLFWPTVLGSLRGEGYFEKAEICSESDEIALSFLHLSFLCQYDIPCIASKQSEKCVSTEGTVAQEDAAGSSRYQMSQFGALGEDLAVRRVVSWRLA
jgi:hypothetical protein